MSSSASPRVRWASFLAPVILLVLAYWPVWGIWFRADDFAWLGLRLPVHDLSGLGRALFQPMAQGTVRVLSERLFFLVSSSLFGNDPLPMRIVVFLLQLANVGLLWRLTLRLSGGSLAAAALVPSLWLLNPGTAVSMTWLSTWNQLLVVFFLLAALLSFIERRTWLGWTCYLLGFGALELNIVFPGLLLVYVWLYERERLREVWLFFAPALIFVGLHLFVIPKNAQDPTYQLFFDLDLPRRLIRYWKWGLGFWRYVELVGEPVIWERIGSPALSALGLATAAWAVWRRNQPGAKLALFGLAWFVALLLPVLPLRNHFSDYYLASASVGMAVLLGVGAVEAAKAHRALGLAGGLLVAVMAVVCWQVRGTTMAWFDSHAAATERLVRGVVEARRLHPNDILLIDQVDDPLYWDAVVDDPFRLYLVFDVYLTPGSERRIHSQGMAEELSRLTMSPEDTRYLLEHEAAQVYAVGPGPLRNVTRAYHSRMEGELATGLPRFVEVARPAYTELLGAGWHPVSNRARWCEGVAEVRIGGPRRKGESLWITGFLPSSVGEQRITVSANGEELVPVLFPLQNTATTLSIPLPDSLVGVSEMSLQLRFSRVIQERGRPHALIVRRLEVR
ncbi:MAG: hypothetical protein K2X03_18120 [Bryobacteraceae bacterium]|nr:hypothetical protein [Bryobacteraceae bacterium]